MRLSFCFLFFFYLEYHFSFFILITILNYWPLHFHRERERREKEKRTGGKFLPDWYRLEDLDSMLFEIGRHVNLLVLLGSVFVGSLEKIHPLPHTADLLMWVNVFLLQLAASDSFPVPRHLLASPASFCCLYFLYMVLYQELDHLPLVWSRSGSEKTLLYPLLDKLWECSRPQSSNLLVLCC